MRHQPDELPEVPPDTSPDDAPSLIRSSAVMSVGTALSRLTGFLRLSVAAWALGIAETRLNDAYTLANTTPNILYELALGGILSSIFVPVFVDWMKTKGDEEAWNLGRQILTFTAVVLGAVSVIGMVCAPWIMRLYTAGITDPVEHAYVNQIGTFFLRIFLPQIVVYGVGAVAIGMLQAKRRFAIVMFAPILNNLIVVATLLLYGLSAGRGRGEAGFVPTTTQQALIGLGTTLGVVAMTVALWPSVRGIGFRFHWRMPRGDGVGQVLHLAKWVVVYVVANQVNYMLVLFLATPEQGGATAYTMAFILFQLPHAIVGVSIFTALLPLLSAHWTDAEIPEFRARLVEGIRLTGFLVIPAGLAYVVLAQPIARLILQLGATGAASATLVAQVLQVMALGLFSFSAFQLLVRAMYAMQNSRSPALMNLGVNALNIVVNLMLVGHLGVRGLAIGLAVSYTFGAIWLGFLVRARLGGLGGRATVISLARSALIGVATAAAAAVAAAFTDPGVAAHGIGRSVQVASAVAAGLLVFVVTATLLRAQESRAVRDAIGRFGK